MIILVFILFIIKIGKSYTIVDKNYNETSYEMLEKKFSDLDDFTKRENPSFRARQHGVAALKYAQFKTRLMFRHLQLIGEKIKSKITACEVGFNAGHSALVFLEGLPSSAKLYSFDLGDAKWAQKNANYIAQNYGSRFRYIKGDSQETLKHSEFAGLVCDVILIDGAKDAHHRRHDILLFKNISRPGALLFLDEVNNLACVSGAINDSHEACLRGKYAACSKEYNKLSTEKVFKIHECTETPTVDDGYCVAEFL